MFQKREKVYEDLIDFRRHNVSTGMVNAYIIKILYEIEGFSEIGYRVENLPSGQRFVLYTIMVPIPMLSSISRIAVPEWSKKRYGRWKKNRCDVHGRKDLMASNMSYHIKNKTIILHLIWHFQCVISLIAYWPNIFS